MNNTKLELSAGCQNMLLNCARLKAGEKVLIVHEDPSLGWYDVEMPDAVCRVAKELGMLPTLLQVASPDTESDERRIDQASAVHDAVIYLARFGDMDRFGDGADGKTRVMSYARDAGMLASSYGTTQYEAFLDLKQAVDEVLLDAHRIQVTCPLGTEFIGHLKAPRRDNGTDVTVRRFPMGVPQPVLAAQFSGRIAIARYLTPTGSRPYEPAALVIEKPVFAHVEAGRIIEFQGAPDIVKRIRMHYRLVSEKYGIDPDAVHSWHAGIHPGCAYESDADRDPDHWSNTVFQNPRFLHFHTCGAYPPGEICWMVLDHTVAVDGKNLWENGRLCVNSFAGLRACLEKWPVLVDLFALPSDRVGV